MEEYLREKKREYSEERKAPYSLEDLKNIMRILRSEEGCPWDRRQTFESMVSCVTEEAKEVIQAVKQQDMDNLCEELGDLLFQVVFYSQMAQEQGLFTFEQVVDGISAKMVRRHPKVFGGRVPETDEKEGSQWEQIKRAEKAEKARAQKAKKA